MEKLAQLYEGKAKKVFTTNNPDNLIVSYKDSATAFNGEKKSEISNKGVVNNLVSNHLFKMLEENGIQTHYIRELNDRETVVKNVKIVPIEVIIRNVAAGGLTKKYGIKEGTKLLNPVLEFCLKDDALGDPMMNEYHIYAMGLATKEEIEEITKQTFKINKLLCEYIMEYDITLIDFKLEYGRYKNKIILADEISPDTCRFWDNKTGEKLDKDRFRFDLGDVDKGYNEIMKRLLGK